MLDLVSNGRAEFGIGEGATRLELGGFNIPAKEKRAMSLEAAEQIANMMVMTPYPGLRRPLVQDALPQCASQARAKAAPADVDGMHQPRHHQDGCEPRTGRAGFFLPRRGGGAHLEPDLLRHHQERRLRAAGPQRQRQYRDGIGVLAARGAAEAARRGTGGLRVLPLCHLRPRHQRCRARPLAVCSSNSRRSRARTVLDANSAQAESLASAFQRSHGIGTPADFRAHVQALPRRQASTRLSCCNRPAATGTSTSANR